MLFSSFRYKQFDSISEGYFSLTLKELFSCEGSECLLNDEQTKNIIQRLKASMVILLWCVFMYVTSNFPLKDFSDEPNK